MYSDPPSQSDPAAEPPAGEPAAGEAVTPTAADADDSGQRTKTGPEQFWTTVQFVVFSLMIVGGLYLWWRGRPPEPSMPAMQSLDPAIVHVLQNCEEAVRRYPRSGAAWGQLGVALLVYEFKDNARYSFQHAERFDASDPRWPYFHGLSLLPAQTEPALEKLRHAVELYADESSAPRLRLANVLTELKQYDEAQEHYAFVADRWPGDPFAVLGRGRVALDRGEFESAVGFLTRAADSPFTARAANQLLLAAYQERGAANVAEIEATLSKLPPDRPMPDPFVEEASKLRAGLRAWVDYAALLVRQGRIEEAKPLASRAVEQYPESPDAWMLMARIHLAEREGPEALEASQKAVDLIPDAVEPYMQIGVTYLALGRVDDAIASFERAVELRPTLSEPLHNLGLCFAAKQQWIDAIRCFRESTRINPGFLDAYLGLADSLARNGDKDGASLAIEAAMKINPRDPRAHRIVTVHELEFAPPAVAD